MIKSYSRGWEIIFDENKKQWLYADTLTVYDDSRPCKRCGEMPTAEGFDACMGHIKSCTSSCCGHGVKQKYILHNNE